MLAYHTKAIGWVVLPAKRFAVGIGEGEGANPIYHEFAPALGDLLGYNQDVRLKEIHRDLFNQLLNQYFKGDLPGNERGCAELLAEGFAQLFEDEKAFDLLFPYPRFKNFLTRVVIQAQPARE